MEEGERKTIPLIPENDIDVAVGAPALAPAVGVDAVVGAVGGAGLGAVVAVDEVVGARVAALVEVVLAPEGALVHVGDAAVVADRDLHVVARHVDEAADVDRGPVARRELAPRVVDLAPLRQRRRVALQRREPARDVPRYRDRHRRVGRRQRVRDLRLADVHEGCCGWLGPALALSFSYISYSPSLY